MTKFTNKEVLREVNKIADALGTLTRYASDEQLDALSTNFPFDRSLEEVHASVVEWVDAASMNLTDKTYYMVTDKEHQLWGSVWIHCGDNFNSNIHIELTDGENGLTSMFIKNTVQEIPKAVYDAVKGGH